MLHRLLSSLLTRLRGLSTGTRLVLAALVIGCCAAGVVVVASTRGAEHPAAHPRVTRPEPAARHGLGHRVVRRHRHPAPQPARRHQHLETGGDQVAIPRLDVVARVVPVALTSKGALDPPSDVREAGWWDGSAPAGSTVGQTLITAHTVHTGGGAFDELGRLHDGDQVVLTQHGRRVPYVVEEVENLSKARLAAQSQDLFGQDVHPGRLVLVTCTGWTGHDYTGNTVVLAHPAVGAGAA